MNNLRKAALEYAKTIWSERASEEELETTRMDFEAGYAHAIEVMNSVKALQAQYENMYGCFKWADFLDQHANESAPEGETI